LKIEGDIKTVARARHFLKYFKFEMRARLAGDSSFVAKMMHSISDPLSLRIS